MPARCKEFESVSGDLFGSSMDAHFDNPVLLLLWFDVLGIFLLLAGVPIVGASA